MYAPAGPRPACRFPWIPTLSCLVLAAALGVWAVYAFRASTDFEALLQRLQAHQTPSTQLASMALILNATCLAALAATLLLAALAVGAGCARCARARGACISCAGVAPCWPRRRPELDGRTQAPRCCRLLSCHQPTEVGSSAPRLCCCAPWPGCRSVRRGDSDGDMAVGCCSAAGCGGAGGGSPHARCGAWAWTSYALLLWLLLAVLTGLLCVYFALGAAAYVQMQRALVAAQKLLAPFTPWAARTALDGAALAAAVKLRDGMMEAAGAAPAAVASTPWFSLLQHNIMFWTNQSISAAALPSCGIGCVDLGALAGLLGLRQDCICSSDRLSALGQDWSDIFASLTAVCCALGAAVAAASWALLHAVTQLARLSRAVPAIEGAPASAAPAGGISDAANRHRSPVTQPGASAGAAAAGSGVGAGKRPSVPGLDVLTCADSPQKSTRASWGPPCQGGTSPGATPWVSPPARLLPRGTAYLAGPPSPLWAGTASPAHRVPPLLMPASPATSGGLPAAYSLCLSPTALSLRERYCSGSVPVAMAAQAWMRDDGS